jgi:hypothetical protein
MATVRSPGSHRSAAVVVAVAWAIAGVLVAHVLAYRVVFPDAHAHAQALEASGHAWLSLLGPLLVTSVATAVAIGWLDGRRWGGRGPRFVTLLVIQVAGFVAIELAERLLAGSDAAALWHDLLHHGLAQVLLVGIVAQAVTAWLGSRTGAAVASLAAARPRRPRRRVRADFVTSTPGRRPTFGRVRVHGPRAPPPSSLAVH